MEIVLKFNSMEEFDSFAAKLAAKDVENAKKALELMPQTVKTEAPAEAPAKAEDTAPWNESKAVETPFGEAKELPPDVKLVDIQAEVRACVKAVGKAQTLTVLSHFTGKDGNPAKNASTLQEADYAAAYAALKAAQEGSDA